MKYNSQTITLKTNSPADPTARDRKAKALAILLGEYNIYGRGIELAKYEPIQAKFDRLITEIEFLL